MCKCICVKKIKKDEKRGFRYTKLINQFPFETRFQIMDQQTEGKWLIIIHGTENGVVMVRWQG